MMQEISETNREDKGKPHVSSVLAAGSGESGSFLLDHERPQTSSLRRQHPNGEMLNHLFTHKYKFPPSVFLKPL